MSQVSVFCYCAFCKSERIFYRKKHLSLVDVSLGLLASLLMMLLVWQDFDPRFLVFLAVNLAFTEMFVLIRWRTSLTCTRCGFDPVLYKRDPTQAAERVKAFMASRSDDPLYALAPSPNLPVIIKKKQTGSKLSTRA